MTTADDDSPAATMADAATDATAVAAMLARVDIRSSALGDADPPSASLAITAADVGGGVSSPDRAYSDHADHPNAASNSLANPTSRNEGLPDGPTALLSDVTVAQTIAAAPFGDVAADLANAPSLATGADGSMLPSDSLDAAVPEFRSTDRQKWDEHNLDENAKKLESHVAFLEAENARLRDLVALGDLRATAALPTSVPELASVVIPTPATDASNADEIERLLLLAKNLEAELDASDAKNDRLAKRVSELELLVQTNANALDAKIAENAKLFQELKSFQGKYEILVQENAALRASSNRQERGHSLTVKNLKRPAQPLVQQDAASLSLSPPVSPLNRRSGSSTQFVSNSPQTTTSGALPARLSWSQTPFNGVSSSPQQQNIPIHSSSQSDPDSIPRIIGLVSAFNNHTASLMQVIRTPSSQSEASSKDPSRILFPLKQILTTCRQISEEALPLHESQTDALDDRKQELTEKVQRLMVVTKGFALREPGVGEADVEREVSMLAQAVEVLRVFVVDGVVAAIAAENGFSRPSDFANTGEYSNGTTESNSGLSARNSNALNAPPNVIDIDAAFVAETKTYINDKTNLTIQLIQSLLETLRQVTNETIVTTIPQLVVPKILEITQSVDDLISSSDNTVLMHAELFGSNRTNVENVIVALDTAKGNLEELGGGLFSGKDEARVIKHRIGTAAYALVRSMKEFCDLFGY
ncbi:hypothetical protein HDU82_004652 [Entophlyctis luteolus]|nr:hypothetical protein HDU82_004652 [Entophlyctis luteolus]